jgi:hypothetical protein
MSTMLGIVAETAINLMPFGPTIAVLFSCRLNSMVFILLTTASSVGPLVSSFSRWTWINSKFIHFQTLSTQNASSIRINLMCWTKLWFSFHCRVIESHFSGVVRMIWFFLSTKWQFWSMSPVTSAHLRPNVPNFLLQSASLSAHNAFTGATVKIFLAQVSRSLSGFTHCKLFWSHPSHGNPNQFVGATSLLPIRKWQFFQNQLELLPQQGNL